MILVARGGRGCSRHFLSCQTADERAEEQSCPDRGPSNNFVQAPTSRKDAKAQRQTPSAAGAIIVFKRLSRFSICLVLRQIRVAIEVQEGQAHAVEGYLVRLDHALGRGLEADRGEERNRHHPG